MASRDLNDLLPGTKGKVEAWMRKCLQEGHPVIVVSTYRSQAEQDGLWAKGRTLPGPKVTWTQHSKHTERRAADFCLKEPKNPWDLKVDVDLDCIPDFTEVGKLAAMFGLQWGIVNSKGEHVDLGHVQDNEVYEEKEVA